MGVLPSKAFFRVSAAHCGHLHVKAVAEGRLETGCGITTVEMKAQAILCVFKSSVEQKFMNFKSCSTR
jgi:hypothetical protein